MIADNPFIPLSAMKENQGIKRKEKNMNEVQVFGVGEVTCLPDICKINISVSTIKDDVPTAKNSVMRRLDYILQAAHNHKIKKSSLNVSKILCRVKDQYRYAANIAISSNDFNVLEDFCNFLTEKLDSSVVIGESRLFHSREHVEKSRRGAADLALSNARAKASDMARQFALSLGPPLVIREEAAQEEDIAGSSEDPEEEGASSSSSRHLSAGWCGDVDSKSKIIRAKVFASFELRKGSTFEKR